MAFNNPAGRNNAMAPMPPQATMPRAGEPGMSWEEMGSQRFQPKGGRRNILRLLGVVLLVALIFAGIRAGVELSGSNDQLQVRVGDQQTAVVDLRQSIPISPQLRGVNVFPFLNSQDVDMGYKAGIMTYTTKMAHDMGQGSQAMNLGLLRFPGGDVGEKDVISYQQMDQYAKMLNDTHAEGMMQAHLAGPTAAGNPHGLTNDVASRAQFAGQWVSFMNNAKSDQRLNNPTLKNFHKVKYWSVGNEPDKQINPLTHKPYTVQEYVDAFIQYSLQMHANDPSIMVFGPEISGFDGIGVGPSDANNNLWMESFLKGVADYETQHKAELQAKNIHVLDGISFHYYPMRNNAVIPSQLMSNPDSWGYLIPQLRDAAKQIMGRDLPISISEINTTAAGGTLPSRGEAALWWADTMGELMNQRIDYAAFFSAGGVDFPYPFFSADGLHDTAMERVMETFANLQSNLVPLSIERNPISVYATQSTDHQTVSLLFVNKTSQPETADIAPLNNFLGLSPWHSVSISVGANSVIVLTLHHDGSAAEAHYFQVSAKDDNTVNSVNLAECGTKTDLLNSNIPC